VGYYPEVLL